MTGMEKLCSAVRVRMTRERIRIGEASAITGKTARALQGMAIRGDVPGAAKIGGQWTFHEATLRAWVNDLEKRSCRAVVARPRPIRSGAVPSFGAARKSRAATSSGLYEQTIQTLRAFGSRQNGIGR